MAEHFLFHIFYQIKKINKVNLLYFFFFKVSSFCFRTYVISKNKNCFKIIMFINE